MPQRILLITPPFTQLNTPYPAAPALAGFLNLHGYEVFQADLGIELISRIFCRQGFEQLFASVNESGAQLSGNARQILRNEAFYLQTVDRVIDFVRYRDDTLARLICDENFLPRASRFNRLPDLEWAFGSIGVNDSARFLATLYIEDIGDLIKEAVTPHFGFSRYAEKLGMSAHSFGPIEHALQQPDNIIESWMLELLQEHIETRAPDVVGISVPFPGNLYAGLKCGRFIRKQFPQARVIMGGGFVNTELRSLSDPAVFECVDFITLDDGELPLLGILKFLQTANTGDLQRTFLRVESGVRYFEGGPAHLSFAETGCPDYAGLPLDDYLSLIETANPMHRLWSDGRWNKMMLAHGCYWHACSFCDTTLDYIRRCDTAPAAVLVDRIERIVAQTGRAGFHFVDEAAPPAVLKELALELLRRGLCISWWANIRFESAFTRDLCRLLSASGCIAATGGLEAASDRLLTLMRKGITVSQAARVCRNFSEAGILVHAYLMYGLPTQTAQETVDALEIVRQFFKEGLLQSAFWHLFTATVHSDAGQNPEKYGIKIPNRPAGGFAVNDLVHEDPRGCDHRAFAPGLNRAVYNFMHGIGMDFPAQDWFDFHVPAVSVKRNSVKRTIAEKDAFDAARLTSRLLWLGAPPHLMTVRKEKQTEKSRLVLHRKNGAFSISVHADLGKWLQPFFEKCSVRNRDLPSLGDLKTDYEKTFSSAFEAFLKSREWRALRENGLLLI